MSEPKSRRSSRMKFSLQHLIVLTTLIAVGIAVGLAHRRNRALHQHREQLLSISSRLIIADEDVLTLTAMPRVADGFYSWQVHVPGSQDYELRLGMGDVSERGNPPIVGSVRITAGQHRVTLQTGDSPDENFQYVVFVDGEQAISNTMGRDWLPGGWTSSSGMNWPTEPALSPAPLQLAAQSYRRKLNFGKSHTFYGDSDNYVTGQGYRLWIDLANRTYPPPPPMIRPPLDSLYRGIGLRDGLRYNVSVSPLYHWTFTRPSLQTNEPMLRIVAEFFDGEKSLLSDRTRSFSSWQIRDTADGTETNQWEEDSAEESLTAYLHGRSNSNGKFQPVIELKWDASRPDEVGLRLADTPANDRVTRWRLRVIDGVEHLWREVRVGDRAITAQELSSNPSAGSSENLIALDLPDETHRDVSLQWQTNETLPLQIVQLTKKQYASLPLNRSLPATFGVNLPRTITTHLFVQTTDLQPNLSVPLPGGPVVKEFQIELERGNGEWIWFEVAPRAEEVIQESPIHQGDEARAQTWRKPYPDGEAFLIVTEREPAGNAVATE